MFGFLHLLLCFYFYLNIVTFNVLQVKANEGVKDSNQTFLYYLETYKVELSKERYKETEFKFIELNTAISGGWEELEKTEKVPETALLGFSPCKIQLPVKLLNFDPPQQILCLYKQNTPKEVFTTQQSKIEILGKDSTVEKFYQTLNSVVGFVLSHQNSVVTGFIVNGNFYGSIRMYDAVRGYHIHFSIEPKENLDLYLPNKKTKESEIPKGLNAFIHEFIHMIDIDEGEKSQDKPKDPEQEKKSESPKDAETEQKPEDGKKERKRMVAVPSEYKQPVNENENLMFDQDDILNLVKIKRGFSNSKLYDIVEQREYICDLCLWIQPNLAYKFGYGSNNTKERLSRGTAQIITIVLFASFVFHSMDFNLDLTPDNFGFRIHHVVVSDEVKISNSSSNSTPLGFDETVEKLNPKEALNVSLPGLEKVFGGIQCCGVLGFIYHNMMPYFATANIRGVCTKHNKALISGLMNERKIGVFDIYRGVVHSLGHLLGAKHDRIFNMNCYDSLNPFKPFINSFPMHPIQQLNIGLRPNSMRMSPCAKEQIVGFLTSRNVNCFKQFPGSYCGNGILEDGEECDCGAPWQCSLRINHGCCGERESLFPCKRLINTRGIKRTCSRIVNF